MLMKSQACFRRFLTTLMLACAGLSAGPFAVAAPTNVFFTQFETSEGYNPELDLVGQNSWVGDGSGGNGLLTNFFAGQGQQAYVGFSAPNPGDDQLYVWRPINFDPVAAGRPVVTFSVLMRVADSTNGEYDYFRWSVYNTQGDRLFSIEFDNYALEVNYQLNGNSPLVTNAATFGADQDYLLTLTMNFASNRWSATLGSALIATNQAINTTAVPLNLGDIDAVWLIYNTNAPGNNYLLFDNYRITVDTLTVPPVPPAQLQFLGRTAQGWALLRTTGENGTRWSLEATTNFVNWTALITNTISGGSFDHVDLTAAPLNRRFYRARLVP